MQIQKPDETDAKSTMYTKKPRNPVSKQRNLENQAALYPINLEWCQEAWIKSRICAASIPPESCTGAPKRGLGR
jgi:hypothetical protein